MQINHEINVNSTFQEKVKMEGREAHVFYSTEQKQKSAALCDSSLQNPTSSSHSLKSPPTKSVKKSEQKAQQLMSCRTLVVSVTLINFPIYSNTDLLACFSKGQMMAADVSNRLVRNQVSIIRAVFIPCSS